ncbi:MAG: glycosyltransferase [Acidobacteriota bacterium]
MSAATDFREGRALVGRLRFPCDAPAFESQASDVSALYFLGGRVEAASRRVAVCAGEVLSTGSYFNSFHEALYRRHAPLSRPAFQLFLEGDLDIRLIRRLPDGSERLLGREAVSGRDPDDPLWLAVPEPEDGGEGGRVFLEIEGTGQGGALAGGGLWADASPRTVRLAVAVCTFRREDLARELVERLLSDQALAGLGLEVFLVDNGRTLAWDAPPKGLRLFANPNLGGSGGFSRGLSEVLSAGDFTHVVLMDDDVGLDTEAVLRAATFFQRAGEDRCLTGCMLDGLKPGVLFEAGARFGEHPLDGSRHPLAVRPLGAGRDLSDPAGLDAFTREEVPDYGGFWFFGLPVSLARRAGLLMPFFLNGDDIEYGLRLGRELGARLTVLPPVGVWHPPFYAKNPHVSYYLWTRNLLILAFAHGINPRLSTVWKLACSLFMELCKFRYNFMYMIVRGVEDALRGPSWLESVDHGQLLPHIASRTASLACNESVADGEAPACLAAEAPGGFWRDAVRLATLAGHVLPARLLKREPVGLDTRLSGQWRKNYLRSRCLMVNPDAGTCKAYDMDAGLGVRLFVRGMKALGRALAGWGRMGRVWRVARPRLTGQAFWNKRFR